MEESTKRFLNKQIEFSCEHLSYKDCKYYPCHKIPENQHELNCFFCYCPFYPCGSKIGDGKWIESGKGQRVYDCSECNFTHRDDITARIIELLYKNKNFNQIKKIILKEFCK